MSENRTSRELSSRVEIDFHKRGNPFQRLVWWCSGFCALLALAAVLITNSLGQYRAYQAGPLAAPHRMFENDCAACHTSWAPLQRLVHLGTKTDYSSIDEAKCRNCHEGSAHFGAYDYAEDGSLIRNGHDASHGELGPHRGVRCAECHREHQGDVGLSDIANVMCVRCHSDLKAAGHADSDFARTVTSIDDHPPFRFSELLSGREPRPGAVESSPHGIFGRMQRFESGEAGRRTAGWQDRTALTFSHSTHTDPRGIMASDGSATVLSCSSCHEPDDDHRYFKPINYESHCRTCHPLTVAGLDVTLSTNSKADATVPHETADLVRAWLMRYYRDGLVGPGEPLSPEQRRAVEARVVQAEGAVFQRDSPAEPRLQGTTSCGYCHSTESGSDGLLRIRPPMIPDRWLPHSRFNHDPHRTVNCQQCHENIAPDASGRGGSSLTGDVLLPKLEVCQKCHSAGAGKPAGFVGAGNRCVDCHKYHKRDHERTLQGRTIEQLLKGE